jgi:hypothetical protein
MSLSEIELDEQREDVASMDDLEEQRLLQGPERESVMNAATAPHSHGDWDTDLVGNALFCLGSDLLAVSALEPVWPALFAGGEHLVMNAMGAAFLFAQAAMFYSASLAHDTNKQERPLMMRLSWKNLPKELNWNQTANLVFIISSFGNVLIILIDWLNSEKISALMLLLLRLSVASSFLIVGVFYSWALLDGESSRAPRARAMDVFLIRSTVDFYLGATLCYSLGALCTLLGIGFEIGGKMSGKALFGLVGALLWATAGPLYLMSAVQIRDDMESSVLERQRSCFFIEMKHR